MVFLVNTLNIIGCDIKTKGNVFPLVGVASNFLKEEPEKLTSILYRRKRKRIIATQNQS